MHFKKSKNNCTKTYLARSYRGSTPFFILFIIEVLRHTFLT